MSFPNKSEIKRVLKNLEKNNGTLLLPENPNVLEKLRWDICQKFVKYKIHHKCTQRKMAGDLGIDEGKISKILHHNIDEFSTDRLISLYAKLDPGLKLKIA